MAHDIGSVHKELDRIKRLTPKGGEYWSARDIQTTLGYSAWDNFGNVIEQGKKACESTGHIVSDHFHDTVKMVSIGSGAKRQQPDVYLDRYACYLVAMNGDSTKPEIGIAQTYFAVQTRRMELQDKRLEDESRVRLRDRVATANKALNSAAKVAGVVKYGVFHDAGYRGLYGGIGAKEIKRRKNIPESDELLDRTGRAELAANEFRITQAEQKIVKDEVKGEIQAINVHREVGSHVRKTIKKIGGTMPEDLPPEQPIKEVKKRLESRKAALPKKAKN